MARLQAGEVAGWLVKSTRVPAEIDPGWAPGEERELTRCVRRSYRLGLISPGQLVVLWVSGRVAPGVHAVGAVTAPLQEPDDHDARFCNAEVLRMPAGSNPSWLSAEQLDTVLERAGLPVLGRWAP